VLLNLPIDIADTHCHLNFDEFDHDRDQVIERAQKNGITRILIPGIDVETSKSAIKYSLKYPMVYAAVGVHPNTGENWTASLISELRKLTKNPKVVAIGEIGLDYYREYTPRKVQRSIFCEQLELAQELGLPVIVHNREATDDLMDIIQNWHHALVDNNISLVNNPGVMHSFSGDVGSARQFTELKFKIGITGPITFRNADLLRDVVRNLELENLLIETDSPYLTPHPYRGKRNEPANVRIVAEKISEIKECSFSEVIKITSDGGNKLFNWRGSH
jgi:TatD DNase family protein